MVRGSLTLSIIIAACLLSFSTASAQDVVKPLDDDREHLGVASCGGTTCHSRQAELIGGQIRQNEMLIWQDQGSPAGTHSRAYSLLMTPAGRSIANNLGLGAPEEAAECLVCHANNVPDEHRGSAFNIADGVTCESCHGGSGDWIGPHRLPETSHAENVRDGLYPLDDIEARASLCLDCHFGSDREDQFVTHRIMGAGHPRMSFELDLFTALQQHHTVDADYLERKTSVSGIQAWAVGQAMAMERSARLFADERLGNEGLFPELYFFDCHACHQTISSNPQAIAGWRPNPSRPLGPGVPVYNDANMIMLSALVAEVLPAQRDEFRRMSTQLHAATTVNRGATREAALMVAAMGEELRQTFVSTTLTRQQSVAVLNRILDNTLSRQYTNYAAGEQAVIAVDTFLNALEAESFISPESVADIGPSLSRAYAAVETPNTYNPGELRAALRQIAARTQTF